MRRKSIFLSMRIKCLPMDILAHVHAGSIRRLCINVYLHLPSVHFHLAEVFPLRVPTGLFQVGLGDPPIDFLPRGFE